MTTQYNKKNISRARVLRKNMTKEEKHLWYDFLSTCPVRFTKQKVLGKYVADFYCGEAKLVIELDGSQHYSESGEDYDKQRTEYINDFGIRVMRISNYDVKDNFYGVCMQIKQELEKLLKRSIY